MSTYTAGFTLTTGRIITKNDIINMCKLLNKEDMYSGLCEFQPERIIEGGIVFKFKDDLDDLDEDDKWYKSVRLCVNWDGANGKWYRVNDAVMSEWVGDNDIIFNKNTNFGIFLKSFRGAPQFTINELKIWEKCFNQIGIFRVGNYPDERCLKCDLII